MHRTSPSPANSFRALLFPLPLALAVLASSSSAAPVAGAAPSDHDPVGVNVNPIEYWTSGFATADLAKRGQEWLLSSNSTDLARTNTEGWPLEPSTSRVVIAGYQRFERFASDADDVMVLRFHEGSASASTKTDVDAFGPGVTEVASSRAADGTVTKEYTVIGPEAAITLRLNTLNSRDAAGNGAAFDPDVELWIDKGHMRAFDQDPEAVFHDFYLQRLSALSPGHVRTTNWSGALYASASLLANGGGGNRAAYDPLAQPRLRPDSPRFSTALPAPWELHAWLGNALDCDVWVNIPFAYYAVNDSVRRAQAEAYVKDMARTLRDELEPGRKCIVEFSNEMWNSYYGTYSVLDEKEGPMRPELVTRFVVDAYSWWAEEWDDDRVEFTAMGFTLDTDWAETQADALAPLGLLDAIGCGGYYLPSRSDASRWGDGNPSACSSFDDSDPTLELQLALSLFDAIENNQLYDPDTGQTTPGITYAIRTHGDLALDLEATWGRPVGLYVYEGGPSLLTNCIELRDAYAAFQHDSPYSFWLLYYELLRVVEGYRAGPGKLSPPLLKTVDRFGVYAFCQPQNAQFGDWLLLTDLYAGLPGVSVVDPQVQWKYEAVRIFNALH